MTLVAGDTLYIPRNPSLGIQKDHHYVIVSSPAKDACVVLLLSITTYENYKDDFCVFEPSDCGEADFVTHTSCIDYRNPLKTSLAKIEELLSRRVAKRKHAIPSALLDRIYQGATESNRVHPDITEILDRQGLLP